MGEKIRKPGEGGRRERKNSYCILFYIDLIFKLCGNIVYF